MDGALRWGAWREFNESVGRVKGNQQDDKHVGLVTAINFKRQGFREVTGTWWLLQL